MRASRAATAETAGADRAVRPALAVQLGQRGDLGQQHEQQRDDPERPDVRLLHDPQRVLGGLAAAEAVGGVGEAVQMQAAGERRRARRRWPTAASSGPEPSSSSSAAERRRRTGPTTSPASGRAQHPGAGRVAVPAGDADREHGQGAEGETYAVGAAGPEVIAAAG